MDLDIGFQSIEGKYKKIRHPSCDIEWGLKNINAFSGSVFRNGRMLTPDEIKEYFQDQASLGRKVIPCAPCDNFDYQTGCKGHLIKLIED